jgi:hypothetical protein
VGWGAAGVKRAAGVSTGGPFIIRGANAYFFAV